MKEEQIIKSARELFEMYGIHRVSMDEIAKNASVTKKTVYSYFASKAELVNYFIKEELNNMRTIVEKYVNADNNFFNNVHKGLYELLTYKKNSFFLNIFIKDTDSFDVKAIKESLSNVEKEIKNFIRETLSKAVDAGYIKVKNIDITTFIIYKMYFALMFELDEEYKKLNDKEIADNILQILKNGLSNE